MTAVVFLAALAVGFLAGRYVPRFVVWCIDVACDVL